MSLGELVLGTNAVSWSTVKSFIKLNQPPNPNLFMMKLAILDDDPKNHGNLKSDEVLKKENR